MATAEISYTHQSDRSRSGSPLLIYTFKVRISSAQACIIHIRGQVVSHHQLILVNITRNIAFWARYLEYKSSRPEPYWPVADTTRQLNITYNRLFSNTKVHVTSFPVEKKPANQTLSHNIRYLCLNKLFPASRRGRYWIYPTDLHCSGQ